MATHDEPEFDPPKITCCDSAKATGGEYHAPDCPTRRGFFLDNPRPRYSDTELDDDA